MTWQELIREKIDMVSHTRHYVYTRTKKKRRARRERGEIIGRDFFASFIVEIMHRRSIVCRKFFIFFSLDTVDRLEMA